ncbi:hypothetical protein MIR68_005029 [Amoeboaphelidium protococcarum]|nr:hypothetical protein MIR68_005029 [Amoeboaphelidium protococcarum]
MSGQDQVRDIVQVLYCGKCGLPVEYCEVNKKAEQCKKWLLQNNPTVYGVVYGDNNALNIKQITESVDKLEVSSSQDQVDIQKGDAEKQSSAAPGEPAEVKQVKAAKAKKQAAKQVIVKKIDRNKRKHVTSIFGLEQYDIDLKKTAKQFAGKFACGSSVSKTADGKDEIVIQGDVMDAVIQILIDQFKVPQGDIVRKEK